MFTPLIIGLIGAGVMVLAVLVGNSVWLWRLNRRFKTIFQGGKAKNLEEALAMLRVELGDTKAGLKAAEAHIGTLESRAQHSVQYVGMIRFNPFREAGGDQSFSIALLDEAHDGVVISSLYSRDGVRVYAKPIAGGASTYQLSEEERQALKKALYGKRNSDN